MIGTSRKINAILLIIKVNRPKLVSMCGYKLATNWQNFIKNILSISENIANSFFWDGATFLTHTVYLASLSNKNTNAYGLWFLTHNSRWGDYCPGIRRAKNATASNAANVTE